MTMRVKIGFLVAAGVMLLRLPAAGASPQATITGQFGDACRAFAAHASKDISHVVIQYVDGSVVRDETVNGPDFSVGGGSGDEIASVVVKSGTTSTSFPCQRQFTIGAVAAGSGGRTTASVGATACTASRCTVDGGVAVTLTAIPYSGYDFTGWTGTGCSPSGANPLGLRDVDAACAAQFTPRADSPPTAVLQIFTPSIGVNDDSESCGISDAGEDGSQRLFCSYDAERTVWTQWEPPGVILWAICPGFQNEHCAAYPFDEIPWTFDLRGSSSTDPDGDLTHWAIDFGDGTSASGSWDLDPPVDQEHTYVTRDFYTGTGFLALTLTVTDAAGHSDTDTLTFGLVAANDV